MRAEELMVGDWVKIQGYDGLRITAINKSYVNFDKRWAGAKLGEINPIPLTPEILEKNGWFALDEYRYEGDIALAKGRDYFRIKNTTICINSVHELQHALRLCNISKDIKL